MVKYSAKNNGDIYMKSLSKFLQNKRLNIIEKYIKGDVLDIGCGDGEIYKKYSEKISYYFGIEYDKDRVEKLNSDFKGNNKVLFQSNDLNIEEIKLNNKFDTILLVAVIEHILNQQKLFDFIIRHLKDDGKIVITTPTVFGNDVIHKIGAGLGVFSKVASDDHFVIYNRKRFDNISKYFNLKILVYKKFEFGCNQLVVLEKI